MTDYVSENTINWPMAGALELTPIQKQVVAVLGTAKSQKYPLCDWYLGAIYAITNTYNPDRIPQAAQSLRELLEKLPRVFVESEIQGSSPKVREIRNILHSRLSADKKRYDGNWKDKTIDGNFDKTIREMDRYLELNKIPSTKEQVYAVMNKLDPMYDVLDQGIKKEKSKIFNALWNTFQGLAHHTKDINEEIFREQLSIAEHLIIDLLAPITAQDQKIIQSTISNASPAQNDIEKIFKLIKRRGANYAFFFKNVDNPVWLKPLNQNGFFRSPPNIVAVGEGQINTPLWWPIVFLKKVSIQSPGQAVKIILGLEETDNPRILREIFSIACDLTDVALSLRLKPWIMRFLQSPYRWGEEELIVKILYQWGRLSGPSLTAALEIIKYVVAFQPDPKDEERRSLRKKSLTTRKSFLEPAPRFNESRYQNILEKGIRPLAEKEPYQVSRILIDATASMIRLGIHQEDLEKRGDEDHSESWCPRLNKPYRGFQDSRETIVNTMTYACEQVYETAPDSIEAIDQALRNQRWKVFKRLRQHLYAMHPNDQTLPWIREFILSHEDYSQWEHHIEFQLMVRKACEKFGSQLLSDDEKETIFKAILSGPSQDFFREWMGDRYSEEAFQKRQRSFHRMQLRPFARLLTGDYRHYFDELEKEYQEEPLSDESYSRNRGTKSGTVSFQSPKSIEELAAFTDDELLSFLNNWDNEHSDKSNLFVEINIAALADVFKTLFKKTVVSDKKRLAFWMVHRENIARPIYITIMANAMKELVKNKNFENLDQWIEFCAWILSHPDTDREEGVPPSSDDSSEHPDWGRSRDAVVDFLDTCLDKDVNVPISARQDLAGLIHNLCNGFDWRLDRSHPVLLNRDNPIMEAINNTRSRALRTLVNFGFWVRRDLPDDTVPEVTAILEKRLGPGAEVILTRPEHALLGIHFGDLCNLNKDWAIKNKKALFPQEDMSIWGAAFGSFIQYNRPATQTFDILQKDFVFALDHLEVFDGDDDLGEKLVDRVGQHLFAYYLWNVYPLTSEKSLLSRFYEKTNEDRRHWARLFQHIGLSLKNSGKHLEKVLVDRITIFFEWRIEADEPQELKRFTYWLKAECLDPA